MKTPRWTLLLAVVAAATVASAEDELTSLSYIAYVERYATVLPAHADESLEAALNMPLAAGDRIDTAREARMEVVLADGTLVWVDEYTTLSLDAVAYSRDIRADQTVLYLAEGALMVEISHDQPEAKPLRIDGPDATAYLNEPGLYRVDTLRDGGLRLEVWEGLAEAATTAGGVLVRPSSATEIVGGDASATEPRLTWGDPFARWIEQRRQTFEGPSSEYVDPQFARQASQLDAYGSWIWVDDLSGWAWQPTVAAGWSPYTAGRWYWTPVGWSWVSYEPWGWLPYHYGSWTFSVGVGWVWSWHSYWSPAWVRWAYWPGYVGWCPYGYYDAWYWDSYGCYGCGGYYPPGHYPPGGGGGAKPPRTDVTPPRVAGDRRLASQPAPGSVDRVRPEQVALNVNGKVDVSKIDRRGWNVVGEGDFDNPRLARVVRPGEVAMRGLEGVEGVVYSGPLETRSPGEPIGRRFETVRQTSTADVTPIMARRTDLSPETARELARPGTVEAAARRAPATTPTSTMTAAPATDDGAKVAERMALEHALRNVRPDAAREELPGSRYAGGGGRLPTADRPTGNPFLSRTAREPVAVSGGRIEPSPDGSTGSVRSPFVRPPTVSSPIVPSTRSSGTPLVRSPSVSSRPVIVPRTAPTRSAPGVRGPTGYVPRSVTGRSISPPSGRSTSSGSGSSVRSAPSSMPRSSSVSRGSSSSSSGTSKSSGAQRKQ